MNYSIKANFYQFKELKRLNSLFSIKGIPPPLNIPTPTHAPAPLAGGTSELGGHEWSGDSQTCKPKLEAHP